MICVVDGCDRKHAAKGYCTTHYHRWRRHGDPLVAHRMCPRGSSVADRLAIVTDRSGGPAACWNYTGGVARGCGWMQIAGVTKGPHVWAYEEANGPVPEGLIVRHTCDNRRCCNPAHLLVGTHQDNANDKVARGRQARTHGEDLPQSKLTEGQALAIIRRRRAGENGTALALEFGVSPSLIYAIATGKRWSYLEGAAA